MYNKYIIVKNEYIYIHGEPMYDQNIQPIVAGYIGNYVDPITQKSYFVFMTRDRQIIHIPASLPVELQPRRSPRSISRIARRTQRREEMRRFNQNQLQQMFANPHNIFNPQLPPAPMQRPAAAQSAVTSPAAQRTTTAATTATTIQCYFSKSS